MSGLRIITDHKWKNFLYSYELTKKELEDFDYMDNVDEGTFFRYRKSIYSLDSFMIIDDRSPFALSGFNGHHGDSFFSGILIKLSDCGDMYKVGTYLS